MKSKKHFVAIKPVRASELKIGDLVRFTLSPGTWSVRTITGLSPWKDMDGAQSLHVASVNLIKYGPKEMSDFIINCQDVWAPLESLDQEYIMELVEEAP